MNLSEIRDLKNQVESLLDYTQEMRDNSKKFIEDMAERFEEYGDETFISQGQADWINNLAERFL